jgi:hypothetical protein
MKAYPMRSGNRVLLVARLCLAAVFIYSGA